MLKKYKKLTEEVVDKNLIKFRQEADIVDRQSFTMSNIDFVVSSVGDYSVTNFTWDYSPVKGNKQESWCQFTYDAFNEDWFRHIEEVVKDSTIKKKIKSFKILHRDNRYTTVRVELIS